LQGAQHWVDGNRIEVARLTSNAPKRVPSSHQSLRVSGYRPATRIGMKLMEAPKP
jgi:hypothetical protein